MLAVDGGPYRHSTATSQDAIRLIKTEHYAFNVHTERTALYRPAVVEPASIDDTDMSKSDGVRVIEPRVPIPPIKNAKLHRLDLSSRLEVLNSWEGVVLSINNDDETFTARVHNLTSTMASDHEAVFSVDDVSSNDFDLLKVGGIFRWMVGYRKHSHGQRERISAIVFRRLPAWYDDDLANAVAEGTALASAFTSE